MRDESWDDEEVEEEWDSRPDDEVDLYYCPNCGAEVYEEAEQCPSCGDYITPQERASSMAPRGWWFLAAALLALAAMLLVVFYAL